MKLDDVIEKQIKKVDTWKQFRKINLKSLLRIVAKETIKEIVPKKINLGKTTDGEKFEKGFNACQDQITQKAFDIIRLLRSKK